MKTLAIIPARSGSKGLKDKNIKLLNGRPLISYTIEAAIRSNCFDYVLVSTDSNEYARIAQTFGARVPFLRSEECSGDRASTNSVVHEVLERLKNIGQEFDRFAILQPTSPLRDYKDIQNAFDVLESNDCDAVVSVCEVEYASNIIGDVDDMTQEWSFKDSIDNSKKRRQDVKKNYRLNGAIYICKTKEFLDKDSVFLGRVKAYIMDKNHSVDIDSFEDFLLAEWIMNEDNSLN